MDKVYVCYEDVPYEGCSRPLAVFSTEPAAKEWVLKNEPAPYKRGDRSYDYMEYVVDAN